MTMIEAVKSAYSNYASFSGRARRSEYWWFALFYLIVLIILSVIEQRLFGMGSARMGAMHGGGFEADFNGGLLSSVFMLGSLLPAVGLAVRRLHDIDRSGWWLLVSFIPLIGTLLLLYWNVQPGTPGPNRFGAERPAGTAT